MVAIVSSCPGMVQYSHRTITVPKNDAGIVIDHPKSTYCIFAYGIIAQKITLNNIYRVAKQCCQSRPVFSDKNVYTFLFVEYVISSCYF